MEEKQIFIKKEEKGEFGKKPGERTPEELINYGIVNIDKPKGPTEAKLPEFPIRFQTMFKRFLVLAKPVTQGP